MGFDEQVNDLSALLASIHRNSLLVEFTMSYSRDRIVVAPYHAHALHEMEMPRDAVIVSRPAVIANTTRAVLSTELSEFKRLINALMLR